MLGAMSVTQHDIDAAIVDLDGTMVDTVCDFEVALGRMLAELGHAPVSREFIRLTVGKGTEHLIHSTLAEAGVPAEAYDDALQRYRHHYLAINGEHSVVFPGVFEGLRAMRAAGWRLACLTNKPTAFAHPLLARKGLAGFFDRAFGGDAFARKKPDPLPLVETCCFGNDVDCAEKIRAVPSWLHESELTILAWIGPKRAAASLSPSSAERTTWAMVAASSNVGIPTTILGIERARTPVAEAGS